MKAPSILSLGVLLLVLGLLASCASKPSSDAATDPAIQKKGHWVTLPPQTGSNIPRRVWVEDGTGPNGTPSMNNIQNGSAADMERLQNSSRNFRPASGS